jgi:hypothetical protein
MCFGYAKARTASSGLSLASISPDFAVISDRDRGIVMLKGIRAMPRLSTLLKTAALASVTAFAGTAALAEDFTVYVYEKGYLPNIVYTEDATRIKFVNETSSSVGIDTTSGSILINKLSSGSSGYIDVSTIDYREIKTPYIYSGRRSGGYASGGKSFTIVSGNAPDS